MLSIKQLLYYTQMHRRSILDKAARCGLRVNVVEPALDEDGDEFTKVQATVVGDTIPRAVVVHVYGQGPSAKVWASCDCQYWLYHCEVSNKRKGSADIIFSNGKAPNITNPRSVPHVCKHVAALLMRGISNLKPQGKKGKNKRR